jgi:hypothetical protein
MSKANVESASLFHFDLIDHPLRARQPGYSSQPARVGVHDNPEMGM